MIHTKGQCAQYWKVAGNFQLPKSQLLSFCFSRETYVQDKIAVVNGLRALAILGVFGIHLIGSHVPAESGLFGKFISTGWFGVCLFFVLSGFVLYLPFAAGRQLNVRSFYQHRLARLYPLYIIASMISLFIYSESNTMSPALWRHMLEVITVSFYFTNEGVAIGNGPLWSLAVEFYMSALFPLFVIGIARWSVWRVAIGLLAATALLKILYIACGLPPYQHDFWPGNIWRLLIVMQSLSEFSLGMWVAILWQRGHLKVLSPYASVLFLSAGLFLLWLTSKQPMNIAPFPIGIHALFFPVADTLLFVVVASALALPKGILRSALTCWPIQIIGAMCFSIYVWHMPMMGHLGNIDLKTPLDTVIFALFSFATISVLSALSYRFIEFPNKSWRELFLISRRIVKVDIS